MPNTKCCIQRGFTLAEMMITIAVMGIVSSVLWVVFIQGFRMWRINKAEIEVSRNARISLDIMLKNLREAQASTVEISSEGSNPPYSKVSFTNIDDEVVEIFQEGNKAYISIDGDDKRFAENIRNLFFSPVESGDENVISVGVCVEQVTYEGKMKTARLSSQKVRIMN